MAVIDLSTLMAAISYAITTYSSITRVYSYPPDSVIAPCAVVSYPTLLDYDNTMGHGSDVIDIPVHLIVGLVSDRNASLQLGPYISSTGNYSVKYAIESDPTLGKSVQTSRVTNCSISVMDIGAISYLVATFNINVIT